MLKACFVLEKFKFYADFLVMQKNRLISKLYKANFRIYDVTEWVTRPSGGLPKIFKLRC